MKAFRNIFLAALAIVLVVGVTVYTFANAPEKGSMGVWGYVANRDDARLEISDQAGADTLVVDEVESPGPAWIVVHSDDEGKPGKRVGLQHIDEGISTDVRVSFEGLETSNVIVAVHADKGELGEFEFDMDDMEGSADRPFFVEGLELAKVVAVR